MERLPSSSDRIMYRKKGSERLFSAFATLFIAALFGAFAAMILPRTLGAHPGHSPLENLNIAIYALLMTGFGVGMVGLGVYGMGPEELTLDLSTRQYRFRRGFPLLARRQTGSFRDIACVYLKRYQNKSVVRWRVFLGWNGRGYRTLAPIGDGPLATRKDLLLLMTQSEHEARAAAESLARSLGVVTNGGERADSESDWQKTKRKRTLYATALIPIGLLLTLLGLPLVVQKQLDTQGQAVTGQIVDRHRGKHRWIYFTYTVDGQSLRGEDEVQRDDYERLTVGSPVRVTYLPPYPRTCRIAESNAKRSASVMLVVYGGFLVVGCVGQFFSDRKKGAGAAI